MWTFHNLALTNDFGEVLFNSTWFTAYDTSLKISSFSSRDQLDPQECRENQDFPVLR